MTTEIKQTNIEFKQHITERLYPIGYKFKLKQKNRDTRDCKIIDYRITHDVRGDVASFTYVLLSSFLSQKMVIEHAQSTIDRATNNGWKKLK